MAIAVGRLHPGIRRQDPEGREQRSERHHAGGEEMQPVADLLPAEQHDAEEGRFEEEGGDHLVGDDRAENVAGELGKARPVRAELVAHDDARDDAEAEGHREDLHPEAEEVPVERIAGAQPVELERDEPARKPDREGREDDVERDREGELDAGEHQRVEFHHGISLAVASAILARLGRSQRNGVAAEAATPRSCERLACAARDFARLARSLRRGGHGPASRSRSSAARSVSTAASSGLNPERSSTQFALASSRTSASTPPSR